MHNLIKEKEIKALKAQKFLEEKRNYLQKVLTTKLPKDEEVLSKDFNKFTETLNDKQRDEIRERVYSPFVYSALEEYEIINYHIVEDIVEIERFFNIEFEAKTFCDIYKWLYDSFEKDAMLYWINQKEVLGKVYLKTRYNIYGSIEIADIQK